MSFLRCELCGSLGGAFGIILILFQLGEGKSNILNMVPCGYVQADRLSCLRPHIDLP